MGVLALWMPSHHPGGCCTLVVDEEIAPLLCKALWVSRKALYKCNKLLLFILFHSDYYFIYTYTLTGHFIRYILLVQGSTHFCLQNCLNSSWHRFNKALETFLRIDMIASHSCCRFVGYTSMMRISRSTTSQRCSIGLRSGDCGGHLSKVNSLSCSRN